MARQREEFLRRFYGKDRVEQAEEMNSLLRYSMNIMGEPSAYRTKITVSVGGVTTVNYPVEPVDVGGGVGTEETPEPYPDREPEVVEPPAKGEPEETP